MFVNTVTYFPKCPKTYCRISEHIRPTTTRAVTRRQRFVASSAHDPLPEKQNNNKKTKHVERWKGDVCWSCAPGTQSGDRWTGQKTTFMFCCYLVSVDCFTLVMSCKEYGASMPFSCKLPKLAKTVRKWSIQAILKHNFLFDFTKCRHDSVYIYIYIYILIINTNWFDRLIKTVLPKYGEMHFTESYENTNANYHHHFAITYPCSWWWWW